MMVQEPERALEGLGGTYFFKDDLGNKVAIVKPCDEEPLAPNNPKVCFTSSASLPLLRLLPSPSTAVREIHQPLELEQLDIMLLLTGSPVSRATCHHMLPHHSALLTSCQSLAVPCGYQRIII